MTINELKQDSVREHILNQLHKKIITLHDTAQLLENTINVEEFEMSTGLRDAIVEYKEYEKSQSKLLSVYTS